MSAQKEAGVGYREVHRMEVVEVVRRWQAGESQRSIARATGLSRNTVEKYVQAARAAAISQGGEPPGDDLVARLTRLNETAHPALAPQAALLDQHRERIAAWLKEEHLQLTRIHELLGQDGVAVSYTTLRRYVRRAGLWKQAATTVRMADWPPGEAAEMDFGKLGMLVDSATGKKRPVWALIVTLPASRYQFVWPMFRQTLTENIAGLEAAWRFFGGVPRRLILDNFAAAVAGYDPLDPRPTRGFLEYSQSRGFFCDPARVGKPRDKPHVESNVKYVRERFFKGGRFRDLEDCREQAERWCSDVAGLRVHGTTRTIPREVFAAEEQRQLLVYDGVPYDVPEWKEVSVHPDHHVSFGQALYSVPSRSCPPGTKVEIRGDSALVKLYKRGELMKVHPRQPRGGRATDPDDYPPEKTAYALRAPDRIVRRAAELGPSIEIFARKLFAGPLPWAKLRAGMKLVSLGERYGPERLDAACARALAFDLIDVRRLHVILLRALEQDAGPPAHPPSPLGSRFARPGSAFDHRLREATG
jgi:transposase